MIAGARLSHHGDDCSFETFLKRYDLRAPVLAEIVHDEALIQHTDALFDGLRAYLRRECRICATR